MKTQEIMTANPTCCTPDDTVQEAARAMAEHDCGCVPVVDDQQAKHLVGVVTDRDLALRGLAQGRGPETKVEEVMSREPSCCAADDDVQEVERIMAERQVRRVPVIDGAGCCVGIVSQSDLARASQAGDHAVSAHEVARTVERISEPTTGPRRESDAGRRPPRRAADAEHGRSRS